MLTDAQLATLTPADLDLLEELDQHRRFHFFEFWKAFPKQKEFMDLGATMTERCLFAGNQVGKSDTGAYEATMHLTGVYPKDWQGKRFTKPGVEGWACGVSTTVVRDVAQTKLCGKPGVTDEFGTGFIPRDWFIGKPTLARSAVSDSYDMISVKHFNKDFLQDGVSQLWFKSYEQGREKFQGPPRDFIWWDEEPPAAIYTEGLARLTATRGISWLTFTPLMALSDVVLRFTENKDPERRGSIRMEFLDNPNYTQEDYERKKSEYPSNEWDARLHGLPVLGAGRVFTIDPPAFTVEPFDIPLHWKKLWGSDFGINEQHPFAGTLTAWDVDEDVFYILRGFKMAEALPWMHAERFRLLGGGIPIAWPHDGNARGKADGEELVVTYRKLGLPMLASHATWPEGGYSTERAVNEINERIRTGRYRVFSTCRDYIDEYLQYHRDAKTFQLVKKRDDQLSAGMKALMMRRMGRPGPIGEGKLKERSNMPRSRNRRVGSFDLFTGAPIDD